MRTAALGLIGIGGALFVAYALTRITALLVLGLVVDAAGCFLLIQTAKR